MQIVRWLLVPGLAASACNSTHTIPNDELGTRASRVVYGEDNREEVYEHEDANQVAIAKGAVVALMTPAFLDTSDPNDLGLYAYSLGEDPTLNLCPGERFASQPAAAFCSGTLIASDLVVTAGHCITSQSDCANTVFVFNYLYDSSGSLHTLTLDDVFNCEELLVQNFDETATAATPDYAIARLDRPASGHTPATVRLQNTALDVGTPLWLAGFPSGIPMKITDSAELLANDGAGLGQFVADFDTFAGNSGSGVFANDTGELVGVFNSGATDYVDDGGCNVVNVCSGVDGFYCSGESSTYLSNAIDALCDSGAEAPFCSCGDGVCGSEEQDSCCADCGCGGGQVCQAGACVANPCASATRVEPVSATYTGSMIGAGDEFQPNTTCSQGNGPDAAYSFTLASPAAFQATAAATDPVLIVMSADACGSSAQLACNDDIDRDNQNYNSSLSLDLSPGDYVVIVDSYESVEADSYTLDLEFAYASGGTIGTAGAGGLSGAAGADAGGASSGGSSSGGTTTSGGATTTGGSAQTTGGTGETLPTGGRPSTGGTNSAGGAETTGGRPASTGGSEDATGGVDAGTSGASDGEGPTHSAGGGSGSDDDASTGGTRRGSGGADSKDDSSEAAGNDRATAGDSNSPDSDGSSDDGCGCRLADPAPHRTPLALALGLVGLGFMRRWRRR